MEGVKRPAVVAFLSHDHMAFEPNERIPRHNAHLRNDSNTIGQAGLNISRIDTGVSMGGGVCKHAVRQAAAKEGVECDDWKSCGPAGRLSCAGLSNTLEWSQPSGTGCYNLCWILAVF